MLIIGTDVTEEHVPVPLSQFVSGVAHVKSESVLVLNIRLPILD
jgi:hypothetical protein